MQPIQLDGLTTFLAVADQGGFRLAARILGVTPSAVSQQIRGLETRLGVALFARSTRSVKLTEAGERLAAHARPAVEMLSAGFAEARGATGEVRGTLRINAPRAALPLLVQRVLPRLFDLHPRLRLDLVAEDRMVDIVKEGFDAGIRFGHLVDPDMVATELTRAERHVVVGSPAFFERQTRPRKPREVRNVACIGFRLSPAGGPEPWPFVTGNRRISVKIDPVLTTNDMHTCLRAALCGVGLLFVARTLVEPHLEHGELVTVLDEYAIKMPALSLYYPRQNRNLPKLRAFVDVARRAPLDPENRKPRRSFPKPRPTSG